MTTKHNGAERPADGMERPAEGAEPEKKEPSSVFTGNAQDADALWASLAAEIPAPDVSGSSPEDQAALTHDDPAGAGEAAERDAPEACDAAAASGESAFASAPEGGGAGKQEDAAGKNKKAPKPKTPSAGPFNGRSLGPVMPSLAVTRDAEGSLVPTPHTIASRLFSFLAWLPILLPLALILAQTAFTLDTRALWYSDEVRYADAYRNMGITGDWLVLRLNGAIYPDKPPMFFWMLHGLRELSVHAGSMLPFPVTDNMIFFTGAALSGILCLVATHFLASLVGRVDRRTVLAANLILVGAFFFANLLHYLRMDLLFTALVTFSHVFLFHALVRGKAPLLMLLGFLFAGAAVLVKGPLGFAFPLLAGVFFLLWQGRVTRLFRLDVIFGLIAGLAVPGAWLALAWMNAGDPFLGNILNKQILARALNTWHHAEPWYHYLMTFPLIWLPWTLLLLFLPWNRFMGKDMRAGLKASRTTEAAGIAYLWCAVLPGFVLLSLVSIKIPIYCLPLFPPLAVLSARAVLRMRPFATACLQWSFAILLALLGVCLLLAPMVPERMIPIPYLPAGMVILGGICLVFACMLAFLVKPRRAEGAVLLVALFTTVFAYPVWSVTAPSLDAFLSPKAQAEVLKTYKDEGYAAVTYKVYPGTYSYYAGNVIDRESFEDALATADKNPKTIMALQASFWDKLKNKPAGFTEVNRQVIAERAYVLVARPPLGEAGQEPAEPAAPEAPAAPKVPAALEAPAVPATPAAPEAPAVPQAPAIPATPAAPETPPASEAPAQ